MIYSYSVFHQTIYVIAQTHLYHAVITFCCGKDRNNFLSMIKKSSVLGHSLFTNVHAYINILIQVFVQENGFAFWR